MVVNTALQACGNVLYGYGGEVSLHCRGSSEEVRGKASPKTKHEVQANEGMHPALTASQSLT